MEITIDKRKTDIIYVDRVNNHIATNDETLKLINNDKDSNLDVYIRILAGANNLNATEIAVMKYLINNDNTALSSVICKDISRGISRSYATIARAIESLRDKRLVYVNALNYVIVSNSIATSISSIDKAKFLVIELRPDVTSQNVSI